MALYRSCGAGSTMSAAAAALVHSFHGFPELGTAASQFVAGPPGAACWWC